jgi:tubulin-folding cofactor B
MSNGGSSLNNGDLLALKAYVTAKDATQYDHLHPTTVLLDLTHSNLVQKHVEIRFDLQDSLATLRSRIHQSTGTPAGFQHLQILHNNNILQEIPSSTSDSYKLGYFGLENGMTVHCVDLDPHSGSRGGQYEDTSLVKKYVMSDEEYDKRKGTLRDWEREQKKRDDTFTLAKHARQHRELVDAQRQAKLGLELPRGFEYDTNGKVVRVDEEDLGMHSSVSADSGDLDIEGAETVQDIEVGMRCQVQPGDRRGRVAFVGVVPEIGGGGYWVGVIFDEPVGKTDGHAGPKQYFHAGPGYGGFVRAKNIDVGDFPERDIFDELDDSDDEL